MPGWWTAEKEAGLFFDLVAQGRLDVDSLVSDEIYPSEAERFYRRLAWGDKSILGAIFRWDLLPERERLDGHLREAIAKGQTRAFIQTKLGLVDNRTSTQNQISPNHPRTMNKTTDPARKLLRIGLIGCGEIAVANASAIHSASNATIAAVTDVNERVAKDLAERYKVPFVKTTEELLARDDVDAVLISVPHFLHASLAIQAARAGKHVLVEKPMATSVAEAKEMIAAASQARIHLATLYCQRFLPYARRAKSLIDQGALGTVLGTSLQIYNDKPTSYYTSGFTGRVATDWRLSKEKSGGGILIFNAVHYLDMIRYLTGLEVTHAYGDYAALDTPLETEDTISATLRYSNRAIGNLTASSVVRGSLVYAFTQLRIWGTDGQIVLTEPDQHMFYTLRQVKGYKVGEWQSLGALSPEGDRQEFISRFARAILSGESPEMTPDSGLAVQAIVEAIYRSYQMQSPVSIESLTTAENTAEPLQVGQGR
jgi:predicted dehydrogenase